MPPLSDLAVLLGIVLGTLAVVALLRRGGVRGRRLAAGAAVALHGVALVVMMTAHCADVLYRLAVGTWYTGAVARYDFRFYSLMLLGALLVTVGAQVVRNALALALGDTTRRAAACRAILVALAVIVPLIPIQAVFAVPLTAVGLLSLTVAARARFGQQAAAAAAPSLTFAS